MVSAPESHGLQVQLHTGNFFSYKSQVQISWPENLIGASDGIRWSVSWVLCHEPGVEQLLQEEGVDEEEMTTSLIQTQNKSTWNVNYLHGKIYLY